MTHVPYYMRHPEVKEFVQTLYGQHIIIPFDWMRWHEAFNRYVSNPDALPTADLLTLRQLLTARVRRDRFSEGHLGHTLESGHIAPILRRLNTLREQIEAGEQ